MSSNRNALSSVMRGVGRGGTLPLLEMPAGVGSHQLSKSVGNMVRAQVPVRNNSSIMGKVEVQLLVGNVQARPITFDIGASKTVTASSILTVGAGSARQAGLVRVMQLDSRGVRVKTLIQHSFVVNVASPAAPTPTQPAQLQVDPGTLRIT